MTKMLLHATWHMTTVAFLTVEFALLLAGSVLPGEAARAVAVVAAAATTGFAAIAVGFGGAAQFSRALLRHPGPVVLTATAALAWWGAFWRPGSLAA